MKYAHRLIFLATLTLALAGTGGAKADLIQPTDARGIRQFPGHDPFLLDFLSIQHGAEDRTVLEFDLRGLAGPVSSAVLDIPLRNLDPGRSGVIDLFTFPGSGIVTPDLFGAGTFFRNFVNNQTGVEHIDVTAAVLAAQEAGDHFLGIRLSTTTDTRWLLGQIAGLPNPTLNAEVIPEPSTLVLWGIGGLGLFGYWGRRNLRRGYNPLSVRPRIERLEDRCLLTTVTNLTDHDPGSLRDAIATTPSGGTVDFQAGLSGTILLSTAELMIAKDLAITGPGADMITVSGNDVFRAINISAPFTVMLSGLTIRHGRATNSNGGGILNNGTLTITNFVLSNNSATGSFPNGLGGGIYSAGTVTVTNSTLSGNSASFNGGGIYNNGGGTVTVTNSTLSGNSAFNFGGSISSLGVLTVTNSTLSGNSATLSGNSAEFGGGISSLGVLTVTNSTLSGNSAEFGGGISSLGVLTVTNSTLSGNSAGFGGGIYNVRTVTTKNVILAGNSAPTSSDVSGAINSQGHNLIGDGTGGSDFADTDLVGTAAFPIDPQLEPLGDYGGPTQTMRPLPGSPVINAGDNTDAPDTDQRGFPRIVLDFIDIGAVELQPSEFGPRSPESLLIAFGKLVPGSWGSVVEAPVSPVARHEVNEPLQHVDATVRRAKDLVFGERHRAQRPVPTSEWEREVLFV
jgi:hypothetical protein